MSQQQNVEKKTEKEKSRSAFGGRRVRAWLYTMGREDPTEPRFPTCRPQLPPCARRGMTTTTLQTTPHPGKEAGLRLQPIRTRKPQVSNLWGGRGSAGGGRGVVGEGRRPWEARTCGVRRRGEAAGVRLPRRRLCTLAAAESCCPMPLLPRAGPGLPPRKTSPLCLSSPSKGTVTNNNNST